MTSIELLVLLLLVVMAVPEICGALGRPALAYPMFVCFGLTVGGLLLPEVRSMIQQVGEIGFVLLLFEVGIEIDLPKWREMRKPLAFAARWVLPQYPLLLLLAYFAGLPLLESFVAAAALSACSVGMSHQAWRSHPGLSESGRPFLLQVMVLLEVLAVVLLAAETTALGGGSALAMAAKLTGIAVVIYACSRGAVPLARLLQTVLERTTRWRLHFVTILVLAVCALGERFGLSGPKTAFFLGLFSSRVRHKGRNLEEYMAPISRRFLIPLFFTALGTQVPFNGLFSRQAVLAVLSTIAVIGSRHLLHAFFAKTGEGPYAYLLFCPNFTLVALAANALLAAQEPDMAVWLLLTGLMVTLVALAALPASPAANPAADRDPPGQESIAPWASAQGK
jgi:Kef-type K+ transport system membrane component KefB